MIKDEKHWELNNLMSPIINYFSMYESLYTIEDEKKKTGIRELIVKEREVINSVIPKILNILKPNEPKTVSNNEQKGKICKFANKCQFYLNSKNLNDI